MSVLLFSSIAKLRIFLKILRSISLLVKQRLFSFHSSFFHFMYAVCTFQTFLRTSFPWVLPSTKHWNGKYIQWSSLSSHNKNQRSYSLKFSGKLSAFPTGSSWSTFILYMIITYSLKRWRFFLSPFYCHDFYPLLTQILYLMTVNAFTDVPQHSFHLCQSHSSKIASTFLGICLPSNSISQCQFCFAQTCQPLSEVHWEITWWGLALG